ncbi:MAG TPA: YdcF family protein [Patescibacteria group bacterium]|nr:YdcF family protein [Patescibacteria group bacterium]
MTTYGAIIVLGSKPNTETWKFPSHVYTSLDLAAKKYKNGEAPYLIVAGKYALSFDWQNIKQPYRECDKMAEYLISQGVPETVILKEGTSKDTITNILFIKQKILEPHRFRRILLFCASFRKERIAYICQKILGSDYTIEIVTVPEKPKEIYPDEANTLKRTLEFLEPMSEGDDAFLDGRFYEDDFYHKFILYTKH